MANQNHELFPCRYCHHGVPVATNYEARSAGHWYSYSCIVCEFTSEAGRTQEEAIQRWNQANTRTLRAPSLEQLALLACAIHRLPGSEDADAITNWFSEYAPMLRRIVMALLNSVSSVAVYTHHLHTLFMRPLA